MSISATKYSLSRTGKTLVSYLLLSLFLLLFSRIYEKLSYGEISFFMHYLPLVTLIGGLSLVLLLYWQPNLSRLSFNLWNTAVATFATGCLLRGIINLSGRSTSLDSPYWMVGAVFLIMAVISIFWTKSLEQSRRAKRAGLDET